MTAVMLEANRKALLEHNAGGLKYQLVGNLSEELFSCRNNDCVYRTKR